MNGRHIIDGARHARWALPAAGALLAACGQHAPASEPAAMALTREGSAIAVPAASPLRKALQVDSAAETTFERPISVPGVIEANPARLVTIEPPVAGRIERVDKGPGDAVRAGEPLLTVADRSKVWFTASVPEKDLAAVFVGQETHIVLNASPGTQLAGRVAYVGRLLDDDTRTARIRVALDNADGSLRPGMRASAVFSGDSREAVTVPASALIQDGANTRVFVERAPWTFEARKVKAGAQIGSQVEIASGLKAGERVVVKDGVLLND